MKKPRQPVKPAAPSSAAMPLSRVLRERWDRYRAQSKACARDFSEESVHESRVAARRLRAALALATDWIPDRHVGKAEAALKKHLQLFAGLRDAHVQIGLLPRLRLPSGLKQDFRQFLREREQDEEKRARKGVFGLKPASVAKAVKCLEARLTEAEASAVESEQIARLVAWSHRRACALRERARATLPDTIHRLRIAFKRFRYSFEIHARLTGSEVPERSQALRSYQSLMGTVQDACITEEWFSEFAAQARASRREVEAARQSLAARRRRLTGQLLKRADDLFTFWPPGS